MAYNIPQELIIRLNKYQTMVENKESIIKNIESYNNPKFLEYYNKSIILALKSNPKLKIDDVVDIMECSNHKINKLKGIDKISDVVNEVKKDVNNLNNIEVIYTPYYINDKNKNGFSYDITYVKIKDELYEIRDVERVKSFLSNKEILKDLSEAEVVKFIKEHSNLIKTNYLEKTEGKITREEVEEEIKNESDLKIRDALLAHKEDVIKEREKLQEYLNQNDPSSIVKYGVNSNEERIYYVGDKIFKFVGKTREMQILDSEEIENLKTGEFNEKAGYKKDIEVEYYNELKDFIKETERLRGIIDKLFNEVEITSDEMDMLVNFIELYIDSKENNIEVEYQFDELVEKWYENSSIDNNFSDDRLYDLYERVRLYRKDRVRIYEPDLDNSAFISTFAILEGSLIVGLIVALIMLFK